MTNEQEFPPVGIRWTIGDASNAGFEALQLSIWGIWKLFGTSAEYAVSVNNLSVAEAIQRTGDLPTRVQWLHGSRLLPSWLSPYVTREMAEGVAWKLAPVRVFPNRHEISLDNDVVLWSLPDAIKRWLHARTPGACLLAADLTSALGQFAAVCHHRALNSGIRGVPPGFDLEGRLRKTLENHLVTLSSELDEQGLQAAALLDTDLFVVSTTDVSLCSPFPNHQQHLGKSGAHFVGLNPKRVPWTLDGKPAHEVIQSSWNAWKPELQSRIFPVIPATENLPLQDQLTVSQEAIDRTPL